MPTTYEYEKPQVKVFQTFTEVPTATVGNQPAFVFGPSYQLFRYEEEHDLCQMMYTDGDEVKPVTIPTPAATKFPYIYQYSRTAAILPSSSTWYLGVSKMVSLAKGPKFPLIDDQIETPDENWVILAPVSLTLYRLNRDKQIILTGRATRVAYTVPETEEAFWHTEPDGMVTVSYRLDDKEYAEGEYEVTFKFYPSDVVYARQGGTPPSPEMYYATIPNVKSDGESETPVSLTAAKPVKNSSDNRYFYIVPDEDPTFTPIYTPTDTIPWPSVPETADVDTSWVSVFAEGVYSTASTDGLVSVADVQTHEGSEPLSGYDAVVKCVGPGVQVLPDAVYMFCSSASVIPGEYLVPEQDINPESGFEEPTIRIVSVFANTDDETKDENPVIVRLSQSVDPCDAFVLKYQESVEIPKAYNWNVVSGGIQLGMSSGFELEDGSLVRFAKRFYCQFRTVRRDQTVSIDHVNTVSDVRSVGQIDPNNPLAYGVYLAKLNSGNCPVYYLATGGTTRDFFENALRKASLTEDIYSLCPLTQDDEILDMVKGHITEMSQPETKRWRIGWVSAIEPKESSMFKGDNKTISIAALGKTAYFGSQENKDYSVKALDTIAHGDVIKTQLGDLIVDYPTDNATVILTAPVEVAYNATTVYEVVHTYTGSEMADVIAARSRHFSDMRMYNVFPSTIHQTHNGEEIEVPGYYGAAIAAGLCSSTLPQQPITNMDVVGISDVPETYITYDNTELNVMAAGGTFIITQDMPYDRVYIRHQLSTATHEGNLLTRELSIVKNVDSISYYLAETCDDLIGKYNITPELLRVVELRLRTAIDWLENNTDNGLYGPQLLEEGTEIVSVAEHPVLKDHVQAYIILNPPKPFNVLEIHLTVI